MNKKILCALFVLCMIAGAVPLFAEKGAVYISPNNDGIQDQLTVPLSVKDKRYIKEWSFVITDADGNPVRTIGNKVKLPDTVSFKSFFSRLVTPKQGVEIPSSVTWNGILDSGETAPDGVYYYYFTASDDNGNVSRTNPLKVIVDDTNPAVKINPISDSDKIFGEGSKSVLPVVQSGSAEDKWEGVFYDTAGNAVRRFIWESSSPQPFEWDGRSDTGQPVPDGVYLYKITATDRAGNTAPVTQIPNIIYSAEKPGTNITIKGSRYASPNGDGDQDTVSFDVTIPSGGKNGANRLVSWNIAILDSAGKPVRSFGGSDPAPASLVFDGKNDAGAVLADGQYQAVVTAFYLNGFEPAPIKSPVFILDTVRPSAAVRVSSQIFSPDGDGRMDTIEIVQEGSAEKEWFGEILNEKGTAVRKYSFGSQPLSPLVWDGLDNTGLLREDGFYTYRLYTTDQAGNKGEAVTAAFELNTGATEVILTVQPMAFSPNGDSIRETVTLTPVVKTQSGIASYVLNIVDSKGTVVKTIKDNKTLPAKLTWNGLSDSGARCPDGLYTAVLETVSKNGSITKTVTQPFELDTVYPEVTVSVPYTVFSPDGDGRKDELAFTISSSKETRWTGRIEGVKGPAAGKVVEEFTWENYAKPFSWDGRDSSGNKVPDGTYRFTVSAEDAAGNKGSAQISDITVDTRDAKIYVTASEDAISPNGDGFKDVQKFSIRTTLNEGIESWTFAVKAADGTVVRSWSEKDSANVPAVITWDGLTSAGVPAEGTFTASLDVSYIKGNKVSAVTAPFISTTAAPQLTVRTAPRYFSPDNDGIDDDLFISLKVASGVPLESWSFEIFDPQNKKVFWSSSGTSVVTERMIWDGRGNNGELVQSATDYPYVFKVTDKLGMKSEVSGTISVDVLVIRIGDVLKIQVPSIIFRSDNADFKGKDAEPKNGLDQAIIDNNVRVIKRIAEILNKFKDYTVRIEGHANNVTGTEAEETSTANGNIPLVPLSEARAEAVRKMLVEFGVDNSRLSIVGVGGRQPVVPRSDKDNWWKNRRVEFILNK